jgi:hypothetical protein
MCTVDHDMTNSGSTKVVRKWVSIIALLVEFFLIVLVVLVLFAFAFVLFVPMIVIFATG